MVGQVGRPPSAKTLVDRQLGRNRFVMRPSSTFPAPSFNIPNHSGDHSAGHVSKTPTNDNDLVNKAYVDSKDELIYSLISDATVPGDTTEGTLVSQSITANTLIEGKTYRFKFGGWLSADGGGSLTLRLKLGASTLLQISSTAFVASGTDISFYGEFSFTCRSTGASGSVYPNGWFSRASTFTFSTAVTSATTIDTTVDNNVVFTGQFSGATSTATLTNFTMEALN